MMMTAQTNKNGVEYYVFLERRTSVWKTMLSTRVPGYLVTTYSFHTSVDAKNWGEEAEFYMMEKVA